MGYLYTKNGYVLIVATPLMLLAFNQAVKIYKVYDSGRKRRRGLKAILLGPGGRMKRKIPTLDTTSVLLLIILVAGGTQMMTPYFTSGGGSFSTDTESSRNIVRAATWKVPSSMTCSVFPNPTIRLGENITVQGSIIPARSGVTVTLKYEWNGTTTTRAVKTNGDGSYQDIFTPDKIGSWTVKASWEGEGSYFGASSGTETVSVTP
jgi:hypothetical protein